MPGEVDRTIIMDDGKSFHGANIFLLEGPNKGSTLKIVSDLITIGRLETNDIVINDSLTSRNHAQILYSGGQYIIKDLESRNGTSVNGKSITEKVLMDKDKIQIGNTTLQFLYPEQKKAEKERRSKKAEVPGITTTKKSPFMKAVLLAVVALFGLLVILMLFFGGEEEKTQVTKIESTLPVPPSALPPLPASGAPSTPPSDSSVLEQVVKHYEVGVTNYDSGKLPEAINEWQEALKLNPGHEKSRIKLQKTLEELKNRVEEHYKTGLQDFKYLRYEKAIREWEMVLRLVPDSRDPRHIMAKENIEKAKLKLMR